MYLNPPLPDSIAADCPSSTPMSNELSTLQLFNSLHAVQQEIQSLSVQLEKGFIDLSGGPARSSDSYKDTIDACTQLLKQGARVLCIGEGGVGKSCLINCMVQSRMQLATEYDQINQQTLGNVLPEVCLQSSLFLSLFLFKLDIYSIYKGRRAFAKARVTLFLE